LGGISKLRMRATSDSGVGDSGRSKPPSALIVAAALLELLDGGGDTQRNGSGEVGRDMDDLIGSKPPPKGDGDRVDRARERRYDAGDRGRLPSGGRGGFTRTASQSDREERCPFGSGIFRG